MTPENKILNEMLSKIDILFVIQFMIKQVVLDLRCTYRDNGMASQEFFFAIFFPRFVFFTFNLRNFNFEKKELVIVFLALLYSFPKHCIFIYCGQQFTIHTHKRKYTKCALHIVFYIFKVNHFLV